MGGFTLIEVLIALFIFAISATALSTTFQSNINNAQSLKVRTFASWIAANKMAEIHASDAFPDAGTRDDRVEYAGSEWLVRTTVAQTLPGFRKVDIQVAPQSTAREVSFSASLTGYVSNPNPNPTQ
ncbi:General secretion pathway protein I [gamma proteobacterium HdN1]|nr:General secretion pathway protein I [gamma proteobacterium HdN1]